MALGHVCDLGFRSNIGQQPESIVTGRNQVGLYRPLVKEDPTFCGHSVPYSVPCGKQLRLVSYSPSPQLPSCYKSSLSISMFGPSA